jgi:hypothetical protein
VKRTDGVVAASSVSACSRRASGLVRSGVVRIRLRLGGVGGRPPLDDASASSRACSTSISASVSTLHSAAVDPARIRSAARCVSCSATGPTTRNGSVPPSGSSAATNRSVGGRSSSIESSYTAAGITTKRVPRSRRCWAPPALSGSLVIQTSRRTGVVGAAPVMSSSPAITSRVYEAARPAATADDTSSGTIGSATSSSSASAAARRSEPSGVSAASAINVGGTSRVTGAPSVAASSIARSSS